LPRHFAKSYTAPKFARNDRVGEMFIWNMPFQCDGLVVWSTDRPAARVLLNCDGKHFGLSFGKGNVMQSLRRIRSVSDPRYTIMSRDGSKFGDVIRDAHVTTLGDYVNRHGRGAGKDRVSSKVKVVFDDIDVAQSARSSPAAARQNDLLATLGAEDRARLSSHLELISLPCGKVLCEASCSSDYVYFPTTGIVSLCHELENGTTVEVAVTGNDGVVGIAAFMGGGVTTHRAVVRNAGYGYRMRASVLKAEFESNPGFRQVLLRFAQALIAQLTRSAVCHGHHQLDQQFRRLLLVSMDLLRAPEIALTHDAVACLLGTRRESITAVAGKLQSAGLIRYHRGLITIVDRPGLEAGVCECYGTTKSEPGRVAPPRVAAARTSGLIANG
jgi:CRP-like cAMP-binding protein